MISRRLGLGAMLCLVSCVPQTGLGRAKPLAPGALRVGAALVPSFESAMLQPEQPVTGPWARLLVGVHAGVSERLEVGGRAWAFTLPTVGSELGAALDAKLALRRAVEGDGPSVSVALSLAYDQPRLPGAPWHVLAATLPLLVGWDLGEHHLLVGPRVALQGAGGYGMEPIVFPGFGASVGFFGHVAEGFDLAPEVVLMWAPIPFGGEGPLASSRVGASSLQLALGGAWDDGGKPGSPVRAAPQPSRNTVP
ncbi:MAG: hypothetical protein FJ096_18480 [Deltaproteobacteria bacterium]|nr:hypothetical protein [Deltaproteobacteria bacterium]